MQTLTTGLGLLESPRWFDDRLWFADWTAGKIFAIDGSGQRAVVAEHRSLPLCFDPPARRLAAARVGPEKGAIAVGRVSGPGP